MKLLILTCSTGGGHTSAARAIAEAAGERGCECTIVDALDFLPGVDGKVISHGHTFVYRHLPSIFGVGYRFERRGGARAFRVECVRGAKNLALYLDGGGFDAVISVHIFASFMLAALCKRGQLELPTVNVATDYTCSPGFAECSLDLNCVPHGLKDEFVKCGLAPETVLETGIPVSREYGESEPRRSAREMLDLPLEGPLALLMCGSMGCGPMEWLAGELSRALPEGGTVAALDNPPLLPPIPEKEIRIATGSTAGTPYRDPLLRWTREQILQDRINHVAELRSAGVPKWYKGN